MSARRVLPILAVLLIAGLLAVGCAKKAEVTPGPAPGAGGMPAATPSEKPTVPGEISPATGPAEIKAATGPAGVMPGGISPASGPAGVKPGEMKAGEMKPGALKPGEKPPVPSKTY